MSELLTNRAKTRGVYFLANDHVFDLAVAFLNSFRRHNPIMPLCLIPFRSDIERLEALAPMYDFDIYADVDYLAECDEISTQFHDRVRGQYRKLAIWDGKFDEFVYIDVDTVVLQSLDFAFDFLADYDIVTSMSDLPLLVKWVWEDVARLSGILDEDQIAYAANTGFIASTRGAITRDGAISKLAGAVALKPAMNLVCYEQPFLNYLIVTSGRRYSSLYEIRRSQNRQDIPEEAWAGIRIAGVRVRDGYVYLSDSPVPANFSFVHWNGVWRLHDVEPGSASLKAGSDSVDPVQDEKMPYRDLWQYYRDLRMEGSLQS